jgi:hypothetical protein
MPRSVPPRSRDRLPDLGTGTRGLLGGDDGRVDGMIRHGLQDLDGDSLVDTLAADADAQPGTDVTIVAAALIAMRMARSRAVDAAHAGAVVGAGGGS